MADEGRTLADVPTWAIATVVTALIAIVYLFSCFLQWFAKWLEKSKRKLLLPALQKIKEELMVFGVMSLLMGHFSIFVSMICVKHSVYSTRFYPCIPETQSSESVMAVIHTVISNYTSEFLTRNHDKGRKIHDYCPKDYEPFASYESLEQLHRLLFVLGVTHITYTSLALALAIFKIYSWRTWEDEAKSRAMEITQDCDNPEKHKLNRLTTFITHQVSHPWSHHKVLVWLLCFSRQFWSSINKSDYGALRLGFLTTHQLPLTYDFFKYMIRSVQEEFCDIVGVSIPLWLYAIFCIFLDFHGSNAYFWLSFLPALIIMIIGTKLHRIVVKLAIEIMSSSPYMRNHEFNLRDELFWFRNPRLLLRLIQFISFQNAFEMAMFIWSLWEINGTSCFIRNPSFIAIRLIFGIVSQIWCSFITFPLYVIVTQMGSRFKRSVIPEGVRRSLHGWKNRVKEKQSRDSNTHLGFSLSFPLIRSRDKFDLRSESRLR